MGRHESRNAKRHKTTEEDKAIGLKQISEDGKSWDNDDLV